MKTKSISIAIENPCGQIWDNMKQADKGRFCKSCEKSVIDFTNHSNAEIVSFMMNSNQNVCGRLSSMQLSQLNQYFLVSPSNKNWLKYLGVLAIGLSIIGTEARATGLPVATAFNPVVSKSAPSKKVDQVKKIYGFVVDEENNPLVGVRVVVLDTKLFAQTNKNGRYEIDLKQSLGKGDYIVAVESSRYEASASLNTKVEKQENLKAHMSSIIMGKIVFQKKG